MTGMLLGNLLPHATVLDKQDNARNRTKNSRLSSTKISTCYRPTSSYPVPSTQRLSVPSSLQGLVKTLLLPPLLFPSVLSPGVRGNRKLRYAARRPSLQPGYEQTYQRRRDDDARSSTPHHLHRLYPPRSQNPSAGWTTCIRPRRWSDTVGGRGDDWSWRVEWRQETGEALWKEGQEVCPPWKRAACPRSNPSSTQTT